jgi:Predicted glutamine amidotransferases
LEFPNSSFNIGVQWHPEMMYSFDDGSRLIWNKFIDSSKEFSRKNN